MEYRNEESGRDDFRFEASLRNITGEHLQVHKSTSCCRRKKSEMELFWLKKKKREKKNRGRSKLLPERVIDIMRLT